jgi:hypothetical protein
VHIIELSVPPYHSNLGMEVQRLRWYHLVGTATGIIISRALSNTLSLSSTAEEPAIKEENYATPSKET